MKCLVVTISGSMDQIDTINSLAKELTWRGLVVLVPYKMDLKTIPENVMSFLRAIHFNKIIMSDFLLVIRKEDGSYGEDTQKEMRFAEEIGRPIYEWTPGEELSNEKIKQIVFNSKKISYVDLSTLLSEAIYICDMLKKKNPAWKDVISQTLQDIDSNYISEDFGIFKQVDGGFADK